MRSKSLFISITWIILVSSRPLHTNFTLTYTHTHTNTHAFWRTHTHTRILTNTHTHTHILMNTIGIFNIERHFGKEIVLQRAQERNKTFFLLFSKTTKRSTYSTNIFMRKVFYIKIFFVSLVQKERLKVKTFFVVSLFSHCCRVEKWHHHNCTHFQWWHSSSSNEDDEERRIKLMRTSTHELTGTTTQSQNWDVSKTN